MKLGRFLSILLALILLGLVAISLSSCNRVVERDYWATVGLSVHSDRTFNGVINSWGEPERREAVERSNDVCYMNLIYEGYIFSTEFLFAPAYDNDLYIRLVTITDPDYRIGCQQIGIGSTRQEVERAYRNNQIIKNPPENVIAFIDGKNIWISFTLSADDEVVEIKFHSGGP
ncbi:MAG: hypothetical protein FWE41_07740 [Coriobacteriia bacterium]|nr:hypothetical protein [Coriobacteriia bacterium]MCL2750132.1 hypothetical protein [Coriobacteriia bacterium]